MTLPLPEAEVRDIIEKLTAHLPEGSLMRHAFVDQAETHLRQCFEGLVAYYAMPDEQRRQVRAHFYAMEAGGELPSQGPTSGELAEDMGTIVIPPLPEELVQLCRTRLMPMVQEHSNVTGEEASPDEVAELERELGIADDEEPDEFTKPYSPPPGFDLL